jgi:hypothetical protein
MYRLRVIRARDLVGADTKGFIRWVGQVLGEYSDGFHFRRLPVMRRKK